MSKFAGWKLLKVTCPSTISLEIFCRSKICIRKERISAATFYIHILLWQLSIMVVFVTIRACLFILRQTYNGVDILLVGLTEYFHVFFGSGTTALFLFLVELADLK